MSSWWNGDSGSSGGVSMWRSDWGNVRTLQEQLDVQEARAAAAAGEQRRLSSQLSQLQGDLAQRVDRLAKAFDAFVELSQVRDQLVLHADARRWRVAARRLVEARIAHSIAPAGGGTVPEADVPGYWLAPAVRALPDVIEGGPAAGELDEAAARDELRTATFVVAAAPLLGAPAIAARWLPIAVASTGPTAVTNAERAIWLAALDGLLPSTDLDVVTTALRARLAAAPADRLVDGVAARTPPSQLRSAGSPDRELATQWGAAESLDRWASWVARTADLAGQPVAVGSGTEDTLLRVVRTLVEEGSSEEQSLLDRAEELGAIVDPTQATGNAHWDDVAGEIGDLLIVDALDDAHPARARAALAMMRDPLLSAADRLAEAAAVAPSASSEVRIGGRMVPITGETGDAAAVAAAATIAPAPRRFGPVHLGIGAVVVVLSVVLAVVAAPGWLVLGLVAIGVVGGMWAADVATQRRETASNQESVANAQRQAIESASKLAERHGRAGDVAQRAAEARQRLAAALDRLVTPVGPSSP